MTFLNHMGEMLYVNALRDRFSAARAPNVGGAEADSPDEAQLPIAGYGGLDQRQLLAELSKHTQTELAVVDAYERANKGREAVFKKLHYLRGPEPLPDYDGLDAAEISAALKDADEATVKRVRVYERKFQHRPDVLDGVGDILRQRRPESVHRQ